MLQSSPMVEWIWTKLTCFPSTVQQKTCLLDCKRFMIHPYWQILIYSSHLIPSFPICTDCTTYHYLVFCLQCNKQFLGWIPIIHVQLSNLAGSRYSLFETIKFTTTFCVIRVMQKIYIDWNVLLHLLDQDIVCLK